MHNSWLGEKLDHLLRRRVTRQECSHAFVLVCVWGMEHNDFDGKRWDGAYVEWCPLCRRFRPEIYYDGVQYRDGQFFIRPIDGTEWGEAGNLSAWFTVSEWRQRSEADDLADLLRRAAESHREAEADLIEVVIACCGGQMGRDAAIEIIQELDLAGFEIVRKRRGDLTTADTGQASGPQ